MLLICLQYFQASTSTAEAEIQGQGEIDVLGIQERVGEEQPAETTGEVDKQM